MLSIQMVKITAARFDSFLKSSVILENIDTIIYKFQLCIYVGHFLKVFIQLYGIFFPVIVRSYLSLVVYVFQLFKMGDKERQGNKNIHF